MKFAFFKKNSLFSLFVPIFLETLFLMLSGMVDTLMLSNVGDNAVGAVGTANTYIGMFFILFAVMSSGLVAVMAQYIGKKEEGIAYQARQIAILINCILGLVIALTLGIAAGSIINALGVSELLKADATAYLRIVGIGCILDALIPVYSCYLRVFGKPRYSLIAAVGGNLVNCGCNALAIFVFKNGVIGVAFGTIIGKLVTLGLCMIFCRIFVNGRQYTHRTNPKDIIKDIIRIGFPAALETAIYSAAMGVIMVILNRADSTGFNSTVKTYAQQLTNLAYCVAFSFGQANLIIVDWAIGEGDMQSCYKFTRKAALIAIIFGVVVEGIIALSSPWLVQIFSHDQDMINMVRSVLIIDIALEIGRAANLVYGQTLKATGDSIYPAVLAMIFNIVLAVGGSYLFGVMLNMRVFGVFIGMTLDECVRAVFMFVRWRSGKWETKVLVKNENNQQNADESNATAA